MGYPNPERLQVALSAIETPEITREALTVLEDVRRTKGLQTGDLLMLYLNLDAAAEVLRIVQESIAQRHVIISFLGGAACTRAKVLENPEIMAAFRAVGVPVC